MLKKVPRAESSYETNDITPSNLGWLRPSPGAWTTRCAEIVLSPGPSVTVPHDVIHMAVRPRTSSPSPVARRWTSHPTSHTTNLLACLERKRHPFSCGRPRVFRPEKEFTQQWKIRLHPHRIHRLGQRNQQNSRRARRNHAIRDSDEIWFRENVYRHPREGRNQTTALSTRDSQLNYLEYSQLNYETT